MSSQLQEQIHHFTTDFLLEQFYRHSELYTTEALSIMKAELAKRMVSAAAIAPYQTEKNATEEVAAVNYSKDDFIKIETPFNQSGLLAALSLMQEQSIPTMLGKAPDPNDAQASSAIILIHKDFLETAKALIAEHLSIENGVYTLTFNSPTDRLRAFNFYEIKLTDQVLSEEIEVAFTAGEKRHFCDYGKKLLNEADDIEQKQDRMLFYYDNIEPLMEKISDGATAYTRADLLTALEIAQVYCTDENFPAELITSATGIIELFA